MYLFDASSIVNLIKRGIVKPFVKGATIDLALYESLNAVWKEHALLKRIDRNTALEFVDLVRSLFRVIRTLSIEGLEKEIFDLASEERITVYDASYVCAAARDDLILVTDDERLRAKASKHVKVISSRELISTSTSPPDTS